MKVPDVPGFKPLVPRHTASASVTAAAQSPRPQPDSINRHRMQKASDMGKSATLSRPSVYAQLLTRTRGAFPHTRNG
jgi:hypothetical protein